MYSFIDHLCVKYLSAQQHASGLVSIGEAKEQALGEAGEVDMNDDDRKCKPFLLFYG